MQIIFFNQLGISKSFNAKWSNKDGSIPAIRSNILFNHTILQIKVVFVVINLVKAYGFSKCFVNNIISSSDIIKLKNISIGIDTNNIINKTILIGPNLKFFMIKLYHVSCIK